MAARPSYFLTLCVLFSHLFRLYCIENFDLLLKIKRINHFACKMIFNDLSLSLYLKIEGCFRFIVC